MSICDNDIEMMVIEKNQRVSFIISGSNITTLLDESLKTVSKINRNDRKKAQPRRP